MLKGNEWINYLQACQTPNLYTRTTESVKQTENVLDNWRIETEGRGRVSFQQLMFKRWAVVPLRDCNYKYLAFTGDQVLRSMKEPSSSLTHTHTGLISPVPWPTLKLLLKNAQCALRSIAICRLKASAVRYKNTSTGKRLCPCALSASVPLTLWDRTKWFALKKWLFSGTLDLKRARGHAAEQNACVHVLCYFSSIADQSIPQKWFMNDAFQTLQFHS